MKNIFRNLWNLLKLSPEHFIMPHGKVRYKLSDGEWSNWHHNIIPNSGLAALARRLGNVGLKANEGAVTYGAVGKGNNTPLATATTLENEIARKLVTVTSVSGQSVLVEYYFEVGEANDTITNMGLFGEDASAAANSGTLFEYAFFDTPLTKTSSQTLTVQALITFGQG